jgi:hypothetical protein
MTIIHTIQPLISSDEKTSELTTADEIVFLISIIFVIQISTGEILIQRNMVVRKNQK